MNYEKEYKEALERAAAIHNETVVPTPSTKGACEYIFHELAENKDEEIRKELIEYFKWNAQQILNNFDNKDVIAWLEKQGKNDMGISEATKQKLEDSLNKALEKETPESWNESLEKQGEQKPVNEVKPKFKVGDTIVEKDPDEYDYETIKDIKDGRYIFTNGCYINISEQEGWQLVKTPTIIEQKPTDKVEPKFKVGDWIISSEGTLRHIVAVDKTGYETDKGWLTHDVYEKSFHLWTINDAKDGDVLVAKIDKEPNDFIYIFKGYERDGFSSYCYLDAYINKFHEGMYHNNHNVGVPATQEQRDLLFQKMKEAGYEWDAEKKELKKIEQKPYPETLDKAIELYYYSYGNGKGGFDKLSLEQFKDIVKIFIEDYGNKSTWNEEDEKMLDSIIDCIDGLCFIDSDQLNWLKSLKVRIQHQHKQEWSEEDWKYYHKLEMFLEVNEHYSKTEKSSGYQKDVHETLSWLKSLKERMVSQPKQEWGEEDEEMFDAIIADIQFTQKAHNHEVNQVVYEREIDWFKSLKDRMVPQTKQEVCEDTSTSEYVDLGLPSGTIWKTSNEEGYYTYDEAVEKFSNQLPTKEQWEELKDKCKWEWKDNEYKVIGPNGNNIFLPAVGFRFGTWVYDLGMDGNYWSGTCHCEGSAYIMCFRDGNIGMYCNYRGSGLSVRLVK